MFRAPCLLSQVTHGRSYVCVAAKQQKTQHTKEMSARPLSRFEAFSMPTYASRSRPLPSHQNHTQNYQPQACMSERRFSPSTHHKNAYPSPMSVRASLDSNLYQGKIKFPCALSPPTKTYHQEILCPRVSLSLRLPKRRKIRYNVRPPLLDSNRNLSQPMFRAPCLRHKDIHARFMSSCVSLPKDYTGRIMLCGAALRLEKIKSPTGRIHGVRCAVPCTWMHSIQITFYPENVPCVPPPRKTLEGPVHVLACPFLQRQHGRDDAVCRCSALKMSKSLRK